MKMSKSFKNHNFKDMTAEQSIFTKCAYCEQAYVDCTDKNTGMLGECSIGKDRDEQLKEEAILLAKAIRILRDE